MSKNKRQDNEAKDRECVRNLQEFRRTYLPRRHREQELLGRVNSGNTKRSVMADVFTRTFTSKESESS